MFNIYDGREAFYQWDSEQKVVIDDRSITQVHYCNRTDDCALICEAYEYEGKWVADVPNILLQDNWRLRIYAYDGCATKHEQRYDVIARSKPDTYIYTETEVLNYNSILERMDHIEATIGETVENYLQENPPVTDLTGYATEDYVDEKFNSIEIPEVDLSDYYNKSETDKAIQTAVENIDIPEVMEEIYVGTTAPTDEDVKVWIDPEEENPFATTAYVNEAIAAIELTPGPAGADGKDYVLTENDKTEIANIVMDLLPAAEEVSV